MSDSVEQRFTSLVQPHFAALYRAAMRLTRRRPDAEDLVQEVCLRACARLDDLGAVTNPRAWLMRALYHLFVDATRRKRRRPDVPFPGDEAPAQRPATSRAPSEPPTRGACTSGWPRFGTGSMPSNGRCCRCMPRVTSSKSSPRSSPSTETR